VLKLKTLRIRAVGRFVDLQTINVDALGNFVQVDGDNKNTGGSSGAAKTTLFRAHDYLLGVSDIPSTILQSRLTKEGMLVEGDYDWDGRDLTISRGKKEGLTITVDGEVKSGSVKLLEEELDKILAVPRDLFRQMFHKRQFARGFFLSMTPKETYEFLTSCLGLEKEKAKVDDQEKDIKKFTEHKEFLNKSLEIQKQGKKATEDALLSFGLGPVKDMHEEVVASLLEKVNSSRQALSMVEYGHSKELEKLIATKPSYKATPFTSESFTVVPFDRTTLNKCEAAMKVLGNKMSIAVKAENDRQAEVMKDISEAKLRLAEYSQVVVDSEKAKIDAATKASQIKTIRDSFCPTCEQTWINEKAKAKEQKLLAEVLELKKLIMAGSEAEKIVTIIKGNIDRLVLDSTLKKSPEFLEIVANQTRLNQMISAEMNKEFAHSDAQRQAQRDHDLKESRRSHAHNEAETSQNRAIMAEYTQRENDLRAKHKSEIQQAAGQLDIDSRAHMAAEEKLRAYRTAKTSYDASVGRMKSQYDGYAMAVEALSKELEKTAKDLILAEEAKRATKSYISRSFDDALNTISNNATEMIRHIPVMANCTIQLEGLRETKDGKVKEEINAVIHMDGEENIPIKSLCGGEETSSHLAIDLAVIDLIEQRTAKGINIFILDEPFTGMDTVCIEMALEVLKNSNTNKKLIIVDHNPEVKQMVQSRLVVVRDGTTSNVVQA
jgi:DNA repair exonuclease SbcCD ATPase subunit